MLNLGGRAYLIASNKSKLSMLLLSYNKIAN